MKKPLVVKVCGMKYADNIAAVCALQVDYMGFIFYEKSSRYVDQMVIATKDIKRTGVFVDETLKNVEATVQQFSLNAVQLHGAETPAYCGILRSRGVEVIKAFSVDETFDFLKTDPYEPCTDLFLFDTKTKLHGGSGTSFKWDILKGYRGRKPFFLSGGIGPGDAEKIKEFSHPLLYGLDLNSRFEIGPGKKDVEQLKEFLAELELLV